MYNNPYNGYNQQVNIDRINAQMNELEKIKQQLQQPVQQPSINQTFQLANNPNGIKYANNIEEVQKETVIGETPFFSRDMSILWVKNIKGEIKSYELCEIIQKDDKDILIESMQYQIEELRKEIKENAKSINEYVDEPIKSTKSSDVSISRTSTKKSK